MSTPGGDDGARVLSRVLRGVLAHGVVLAPETPVEHYDAVAEAVAKGLGEFGWGLSYDQAALQAHIDQLSAAMPPIPAPEWTPTPPERLNG